MTEDKVIKAIATFIRQTQEGTLLWMVAPPPDDLTKGTESIVKTVYSVYKDGRLLRIFPYKAKYYTDVDEWEWVDRVALEVSNLEQNAWWRFPENSIVKDLLEAVRFKVIGVDDFIEGILKKQDDIPF